LRNRDGSDFFVAPHPVLAADAVRYVGEPVALVVAETLAAAMDAAERVSVDYRPLAADQAGCAANHAAAENRVEIVDRAFGAGGAREMRQHRGRWHLQVPRGHFFDRPVAAGFVRRATRGPPARAGTAACLVVESHHRYRATRMLGACVRGVLHRDDSLRHLIGERYGVPLEGGTVLRLGARRVTHWRGFAVATTTVGARVAS